uniref:Uncharacterized protein n=1 Tax=Spyridia filamentosa TaxID=196632 RepID=A0A1Z1MKD8_SPYFI|nr:hypothetical protein [Spyridia filamentosa]ARW66224.1 hypothetical protein [Spyridia filamentosa]
MLYKFILLTYVNYNISFSLLSLFIIVCNLFFSDILFICLLPKLFESISLLFLIPVFIWEIY